MAWEYRPAFDAGFRAALESRKNVIFVCPPAVWALAPLVEQFPTVEGSALTSLVLVPDTSDAVELAAVLADSAMAPAYAATGVARTAHLLADQPFRSLVATPGDTLALLRMSALDATALHRIIIAWPHLLEAADQVQATDVVLSEARDAVRIVVTADPQQDAPFIERHARRAPLAIGAGLPARPVAAARYAVVATARLGWAVRAALNGLDPATALVWDPRPTGTTAWGGLRSDATVSVTAAIGDQRAALAIATALPSDDALAALAEANGEVLVLLRGGQVPYLERLAAPLKVYRLPSEADRARDAASQLRAGLRERLTREDLGDRLQALAPLFDEYDPALVAAAATAAPSPGEQRQPVSDVPTWVALNLNVGRKDRMRPADVVGLLLNSVGLPKDQVGLIDIRDSFTVAYVRSETAAQARQGLNGQMLKGRRLAVRVDRG